ncbi:MAG TPA: hypothetical protein VK177_18690 [Flavobacteriales bacterium]|nr:hypothetical protein [Flavobacteriales bacterium]
MKFFLAFIIPFLLRPAPGLERLRDGYFNAAANKESLPVLLKSVEKSSSKDHIYYCYRSAYYSLEANFTSSITKKLKYFNLCKDDIAKSFSIKDSFDARFIRFCIQSESPSFLGYNQNVEDDKKYILQHLKSESPGTYKTNVKAYLNKCNVLTEKEKERVQGL